MSGGSLRGLLFFGHLNKFTVTVTVFVSFFYLPFNTLRKDCSHFKLALPSLTLTDVALSCHDDHRCFKPRCILIESSTLSVIHYKPNSSA